MTTTRSFKDDWVQLAPGFQLKELFKNDVFSIVHIRMEKRELPHYPPDPNEWSVLESDMDTTILLGAVDFQEEGKDSVRCWCMDNIHIPRGTRYRWILFTPMVIMQSLNNPPFSDKDRKV